MSDNVLYRVGMQIGYTSPENEDCEVTGNWIVRGSLQIQRYQRVVNRGNRVLGPDNGRPAVPTQVLVQPYRLDPNRANVVVFNGNGRTRIAMDPAPLLRPGRAFRLMDLHNFYGKPVLTGKYEGKSIEVPIRGEFAAYVLLGDGVAVSGKWKCSRDTCYFSAAAVFWSTSLIGSLPVYCGFRCVMCSNAEPCPSAAPDRVVPGRPGP